MNCTKRIPGTTLAAALAAVAGAATADAQTSFQKISALQGGIPSGLDDEDRFGSAVASIGDLDGDGIEDLVVGTPLDDGQGDNRGALWVLFLDEDGSVKDRQKVNSGQGDLVGPLDNGDQFGASVAHLGDLDGDGVSDILVGARTDGDGANNAGAVYVAFLETDGRFKAEQKISASAGGLSLALSAGDQFGAAVANLGDLDDDGVVDVAVGAPRRDDGGANRGAVSILFLNPDGTVKAEQTLNDLVGGVVGLENGARFGTSLAGLGDLDGDGVEDLAVGAEGVDDGGSRRGAVWILFLNTDGTVKAQQKISQTEGGFAGQLDDLDYFGTSLGLLDDLDGDGFLDLAVGARRDDDGGSNRGAVWILALRADGSVQYERKLSDLSGGFGGTLSNADNFGSAVCLIGDVDEDGSPDIAVGAFLDDDGGVDTGALWVLLMGSYATVEQRNGSGINPVCLQSENVPILGEDWVVSLDASVLASAASSFVIGFSASFGPGVVLNAGELLVDPTGGLFVGSGLPSAGGVDVHVIPIANDTALLGFPIYTQGIVLGGGQAQFCNALDIVSGY